MSFDGPDQILPIFHHHMTFDGPKNLMSFDGPKSRFSPFKISCQKTSKDISADDAEIFIYLIIILENPLGSPEFLIGILEDPTF